MCKNLKALVLPVFCCLCLVLCALFLVLAIRSRPAAVLFPGEESEQTAMETDTTASGEDLLSAATSSLEDSGDGPEEPLPEHIFLDVPAISQNPELPNGCEIVALSEVLAYLGVDADRLWLVRNYFPCCAVGEGSPNEYFVGDPTSSTPGTAFGCFAPVVVRAANAYLSDIGSEIRAVNLTGTPIDELCGYVARGIPVILWTTKGMQFSRVATVWKIDGADYPWLVLSHCSVLSGYTPTDLIFSDPLEGIVSYYREEAEAAYRQQYMQAVALLTP